jgi:excisionase family DNA binding protein
MGALSITLKEAAELLGLSDPRTVLKYAREKRIRVTGGGGARWLVVRTSIDDYLEGRSEWHRERAGAQPAESPTPARSGTRKGVRSRTKPPSPSNTTSTATITFLRDRKLKRT